MKKMFKKLTAILLIAMFFSSGLSTGVAFANENEEFQDNITILEDENEGINNLITMSEAGKSRIEQAIDKTAGYFAIVKKGNKDKAHLDNFWQIAAIKAAGLKLSDYTYNAVTNDRPDYEKYFYYTLTGNTEGASAIANQIVAGQNSSTGSLSSGYTYHIWNMIALDIEEKITGNMPVGYEKEKALNTLLSMAKSDGSYGLSGKSDTDISGMALIALSNHKGKTVEGKNVDTAIEKAVTFIKTKQTNSGGFTGEYGENINSVAAAVSGLIAAGEDLTSPESDWSKNGNSISDYVLNKIEDDGTFGNDLATEQGYIAMMELSAQKCIWNNVGDKIVDFDVVPDGVPGEIAPDDSSVKVSMRVEGKDGLVAKLDNDWVNNFDLTKYGLSNTQKVSGVHVLIKALEKAKYDCTKKENFDVSSSGFIMKLAGLAPPAGDYNASWFSLVNDAPLPNGQSGYGMTITEYLPVNGDDFVIPYLKHYGTSWFNYFEKDQYNAEIGQDITLTLNEFSINDAMWGSPITSKASSGVAIYVDGIQYDGWTSNTTPDGKITLRFMKEGTYVISGKYDDGIRWITRPEAKVVVTGKDVDKTVSLRVEGSSQNIAYAPSLVVKTDGRKLSVKDALAQLLDEKKISYELYGAYLAGIANETGGKFGGFDGWMYLVNGQDATTSMDKHIIKNGDEILFYYGVYGASNPKVNMKKTVDDGIEITFTYESFNWYTYNIINLPIIDAIISAFGKTYTTDQNGKVIISKTDIGDKKSSSLQIEKISDGTESDGWGGTHPAGAPLVIRLAPDYTIKLAESGQVMEQVTVADTPVVITEGKPVDIIVPAGITAPAVNIPASGVLPQIEVKNNTLQMSFASGTAVTNSSGKYTGEIKLPTITVIPDISLTGSNVAKPNIAIKMGSDSEDLYFSEPVRLLIPGGKGLSIGVIGADGILKNISAILSEDSLIAAKNKLIGGINEAKIDVGSDTVVWTNHLSTYLSYTISSTDPGSNPPINTNITLYVERAGSFTLTYSVGQTPLSILLEKVNNVSHSGGYVSAINGRREFDEGPGSGWMYSVNGTFYKVGAASMTLSPGDSVSWRYTKNYGDDLTGTNWSIGGVVTDLIIPLDPESMKKLEDAKAGIINLLEKKKAEELSDFEIMNLAIAGKANEQMQKNLIKQVTDASGAFRKITDIARIILAAKSLGLNPTDLGGYNMVSSLINHENVEMQGVNGPAFTLLAYDALSLRLPNTLDNTRDKLKTIILSYQNTDGGFPLAKGSKSDPDMTAMVLTSLAPYKNEDTVKNTVEKSIAYLSKAQRADGGFLSDGVSNSESISQVIIALCALGINPLEARFLKGEEKDQNLLLKLFSFQNKDGGFSHISGDSTNTIATEQAGLAILAYEKYLEGEGSIYTFASEKSENTRDFIDKKDIASWAVDAVEECQQAKIIVGDTNGNFNPKKSVTRAETATMLSEMLMILDVTDDENTTKFNDVSYNAWYKESIEKIISSNIMNGIGNKMFMPESYITRQDIAVVLVNALDLSEKKSNENKKAPNDLDNVSGYAKNAVSIVYNLELMQGSNEIFSPKQHVSKEMMAVILARVYEEYFN